MKLLHLLSVAALAAVGLAVAVSPQDSVLIPILCSKSFTNDWLECEHSNSGKSCVQAVCKQKDCNYFCPFCIFPKADDPVAAPVARSPDTSSLAESIESKTEGSESAIRPCPAKCAKIVGQCLSRHSGLGHCLAVKCHDRDCTKCDSRCGGKFPVEVPARPENVRRENTPSLDTWGARRSCNKCQKTFDHHKNSLAGLQEIDAVHQATAKICTPRAGCAHCKVCGGVDDAVEQETVPENISGDGIQIAGPAQCPRGCVQGYRGCLEKNSPAECSRKMCQSLCIRFCDHCESKRGPKVNGRGQ